jgi:hypothetical protein
MTTTVNKYRIFCETESAYKTVWGEEVPTLCPSDTAHTIDTDTITIVDTVTQNDVVVKSQTTNSTYIPQNVFVDGSTKIDVLKTAFEDLSVAQPFPIVQTDFVFSVNPDIIDTVEYGSGTVTQSGNMAVISSGAASNSYARLLSERQIRYKPGMGVRMLATSVMTPGVEGNTQILGIGNNSDGFFFGYNGPDFGIMRRCGGVDHWTPQTQWNVDRMDGTGLSGQTLHTSNGNIYMIQMQWLGFGAIKFFIEETNSGRIHPVHVIRYANTSPNTTVQVPIFNVCLESKNTTNTSDVVIKTPCISAFIEGTIHRILGPRYGIDNDKYLSENVFTNILTIRVKTSYNGKTNKIPIHINNLSASTSRKPIVIVLIKNATIVGDSAWKDINTVTSVVEYDTLGTTLTGGRSLKTFCIGPGSGYSQTIDSYAIVIDAGCTLTIAARVPTAENTSISAAINWMEDH